MGISDAQLRALLVQSVADFSNDRRAAGHIRWFAEHAPEILFSAGIEILLNGSDSTGVRYLCMQMLKEPGFFREMTDPWKYSVTQAVKLGRKLLAVDRSIDIQLARCLPARNGNDSGALLSGEWAERALLVLDEISVGRRIVPVLNHLSKHNDVRISSKSALLVGKRVQSLAWARRLLVEAKDPRIRASAVEAFWGVASKPAMQLFRGSLSDANNRVVGNSIMGLHLGGDPDVNKFVLKSAEDCKASFRSTASWLMGKIGDPLYVPSLSNLVRDSDPSVRSAALRSLREIRQEEKWRLYRENELDTAPILMKEEPAMQAKPVIVPPEEVEINLWLDGGRLNRELPLRNQIENQR